MESQDSPKLSVGPSDASGSEDHMGIFAVNRVRSSNTAPQGSACFGSHVDDDASSFQSREGISEKGPFDSVPLSAEASNNIASTAATARTWESMQSAAVTWRPPRMTVTGQPL
eukprot:366004-Chlamydomonas_euryale.AAC.3